MPHEIILQLSTCVFEDLGKAGVIDPTEVTHTAPLCVRRWVALRKLQGNQYQSR